MEKEIKTYISVYEKSMPDTLSLAEKMETAVRAGFDGVEISVDETDKRLSRVLDPVMFRETLKEIRSVDVPIRTMCLSGQRKYPFGSRNADVRKKSMEIIGRAVDFSAEAGIRIIQIPGYDVWYEERGIDTEKYFAEGIQLAAEYAASAGVTLAFETMENDFMNTTSKAMKYVSLVNNPYLQIYPDLGNVRNGTDDYLNDLKSGKGHISAVHLKDTVEGVFRNLELGEGRVDFVNCIRETLSQGVRMYNCEIWYDSKSEPVELLGRNRQFIGRCFTEAKKNL